MAVKQQVQTSRKSLYVVMVGVIIVISSVLVWLSAQQSQLEQQTVVEGTQPSTEQLESGDISQLPLITDRDLIRGNNQASVILVEYSDLNCQFCKQYHATMLGLIDTFPELGWVYRHMPLLDSETQSAVAHCVQEQYGEEKFWEYVDAYFIMDKDAPTAEDAVELAGNLQFDVESIERCAAQEDVRAYIEESHAGGIASGVVGTPTTVLVVDGVPTALIEGAASYEDMEEYLSFYFDK